MKLTQHMELVMAMGQMNKKSVSKAASKSKVGFKKITSTKKVVSKVKKPKIKAKGYAKKGK